MDIAKEPGTEKRSGKAGRILGIIGTILLIGIVTGLIFVCIFAFYVKTCITPSLDLDLNDFTLNQSSIIYYKDANGDYQKLTTVSSSENRIWVDGDQIPQHMKDALVAIEDKRFYTHKGVDWFRTAHAALNMFTGGSTFGGSTITQQLIKNLTQQDDITVQRKLLEIFQALDFEKKYDKEEILEWYLNAVYFGEGCYGVQTAAQTYFGKDAKDLTIAEAASIVGITNLPTYYDPFYSVENNKERQENVLREMYKQGYINKSEYEEAVNQELDFVRGENSPSSSSTYTYYEEVVLSDVITDLAEAKGISRVAASLSTTQDTRSMPASIRTFRRRSMRSTQISKSFPRLKTAQSRSFRAASSSSTSTQARSRRSPAARARRRSATDSTEPPAPQDRPDRPLSPSRSTARPSSTD